ncbi:TBC1 domain family member 12 [Biomphalaria pfeifferi]|uniref:TBC1 domain family member 12 n=1 Tax=Biomphalaria pfeifferi TaxID=112525 RepID=A0AAD8FB43_BIOPF|nr:TBC1 domain family member 12 [Biomphalaria pfeifferi]
MGKYFPRQFKTSRFHSLRTMRLRVMSDPDKSIPRSGHCNGEARNLASIDFEDVEALKNQMKVKSKISLVETLGDSSLREDEHTIPYSHANSFLQQEAFVISLVKSKDCSDDVEATLSLSSDKTLDFEHADNSLRTLEDSMGKFSIKNEQTISSNGCTAPVDEETVGCTSHCNSQFNYVMSSPKFTDDLPVELGKSARFSKVLENISLPLLYIPTTRQLVKSNDVSSNHTDLPIVHTDFKHLCVPDKDYSCNESESASSNQDLSCSELLSPRSPMHKAYSAQEFHYSADSDRYTLHSVDSFPGFQHNFEPSHYLFADNSSLSSVSTGTDFSVSAVSVGEDFTVDSKNISDEALFMDINLHSRNSFDKGGNSSSLDSGYGERKAPQFQAAKKKSFTSLKNLFSKKTKEDSLPGWKLFGRIPPKDVTPRNPHEITSEFQARQSKIEKPSFPAKKQCSEVMSTTALILENRPGNLPSKSPEEAEKHRQQYEAMIEAAKKKELKDMKQKKKQLLQQRKLEDQMMAAAKIWDTEILPNWEAMRHSKKAKDLWWLGLPPCVRGKVWQLAIGNDLNITHALYSICHERAEERITFIRDETQGSFTLDGSTVQQEPSNKESSVRVIKLDVSRTFPHLCIFQKGGPLYDLLHSLLGAYACYRPDVGYVQGMSFIAAILLLNMDVADAFVCFANLLNRPCQLAFFRMDENLMTAYYRTFEEFFKENLPRLYAHFICLSVTPNLYLMEWVFLLYSKSLPLDVACRVWDVFFRDGEEFLFRTALAILNIYESILLKMDFIHVAQFLTKLPEDISVDHLFKEVENIRMHIDKKGFQAVYAMFKEPHEGVS